MYSATPVIFDRFLLRRRRDRAAVGLEAHDFLLREMADRLASRLEDIQRQFPLALDLGCHTGQLARALAGRGGIQTLVQADLSSAMVQHAKGLRVTADEEALPFAENTFDLVLSCGSLHWVNDLPGTLAQVNRILKPDGLFLALIPGGDSLHELRSSFLEAEERVMGGASPRVSPTIDVRDAGALLQRAGFALPVADAECITVRYEHPLKLLQDLRAMGESSVLLERPRKPLPRRVLEAMARLYHERYVGEDGRIPATFECITLTAWKPHASQQQPARRGSGKVSLGEIF